MAKARWSQRGMSQATKDVKHSPSVQATKDTRTPRPRLEGGRNSSAVEEEEKEQYMRAYYKGQRKTQGMHELLFYICSFHIPISVLNFH